MDALYWVKVDCNENAEIDRVLNNAFKLLKISLKDYNKYITDITFDGNSIWLYANKDIESVVGNEIAYKDIKLASDFEQIKSITIGHIGE